MKAYNKIDLNILLDKVREGGICGKLGQWIGSFVTDRTQTVKIGASVSDSVNILSGVPQGLVLGPILFLFYIADIGHKSNSECCIYIDDSKV